MLREIAEIIERFRMKPSDLKIYNLLLSKGGMTVREIARELDLSPRFVRERLKELMKREIIKRRLVERKWIGYIYEAEHPKKVVLKIAEQLNNELKALSLE